MELAHAILLLFVMVVVALLAARRRPNREALSSGGFGTTSGLHWLNRNNRYCDERGCYIRGHVLY